MILGEVCTRRCRFCAVKKGRPLPVDATEPIRIARVARALNLRHMVITSVTRDDLADGGAEHFASTVRAIRTYVPEATVEVLTPDFKGSMEALDTVLKERPEVFNHNVETIPRLYPEIRPEADYERSLKILQWAKELSNGRTIIKSGIMVGIGEKPEEVLQTMDDLLAVGVEVLTIGQYLQPTKKHLEVLEYVTPEQFKEYEIAGKQKGFKHIESSPLVRSSYRAEKHIK